jgi:hypothetical protein
MSVTEVRERRLRLPWMRMAQEPTDLGKGAEFKGQKIEMKDKGEVAYVLSFTAGKGSRPRRMARRTPMCTCTSTTRAARKSARTTRLAQSVR